jgi:hypothetical protein
LKNWKITGVPSGGIEVFIIRCPKFEIEEK